MMKRLVWTLAALMLVCANLMAQRPNREPSRIVVAYVTSNPTVMPDPSRMTHINYAFGHVNDTFNGVRINNESRLHSITALKKDAPWLKVCLSIGGWGSGRFSEMAATDENRKAFAADCARVVAEFDLDGIDLDWEYPTSSAAGISSSPDDTKNFTILVKEIRKAIGTRKLLTMASPSNARFVDFPDVLPYMDFINVMAYDMNEGDSTHHAALYSSDISGNCTSNKAVEAHLKAGVPKEKLVLGVPFYGKGHREDEGIKAFLKTGVLPEGYEQRWSEDSQVPYIVNAEGLFVWGYENVKSLSAKCQYILDHNLRGGMYWDYASDNAQHEFSQTLYRLLLAP